MRLGIDRAGIIEISKAKRVDPKTIWFVIGNKRYIQAVFVTEELAANVLKQLVEKGYYYIDVESDLDIDAEDFIKAINL